MKASSALPALLLSLMACATRPGLAPGTYHETRPNAVLFASKELRLYPDGRFAYFQHTDMVGAGRQAAGSYRLRGGQLQLRADGTPPFPASYAKSPALPGPANTKALTFRVFVLVYPDKVEPLPGANVLLYDEAGRLITAASTDDTNYVSLSLAQKPTPHKILVTSIGLRTWEAPWPGTATDYEVFLAPNVGLDYEAGTRLTFRVLDHSPSRLVLSTVRDTITMVARP